MEEKQLIHNAKNGDVEAFEIIIEKYQQQIFNIAFRMMGNYDDASDSAQNAIIKIFKNLKNFEGKSKLSTWIYRIVTNTCLDELRKKSRQNIISINQSHDDKNLGKEIQIEDKGNSPQDHVEKNEMQKVILNALEKMSPDHKAVIVLRDIKGLSYEEIARIVECNEGTVKSRINRARKSLKKALEHHRELFEDYIV